MNAFVVESFLSIQSIIPDTFPIHDMYVADKMGGVYVQLMTKKSQRKLILSNHPYLDQYITDTGIAFIVKQPYRGLEYLRTLFERSETPFTITDLSIKDNDINRANLVCSFTPRYYSTLQIYRNIYISVRTIFYLKEDISINDYLEAYIDDRRRNKYIASFMYNLYTLECNTSNKLYAQKDSRYNITIDETYKVIDSRDICTSVYGNIDEAVKRMMSLVFSDKEESDKYIESYPNFLLGK